MHLLGRGLPNKYRLPNADIQTVCLLLLCNSLISFHPLSPLGLMNREEFFVFQKIFSKTPPKKRFPFQTSEGVNFLKEILKIRSIWVCILPPFVQMSERSFFYGKIIKEIKTGMVLFYQSQNRQKNIQRFVPKMSE